MSYLHNVLSAQNEIWKHERSGVFPMQDAALLQNVSKCSLCPGHSFSPVNSCSFYRTQVRCHFRSWPSQLTCDAWLCASNSTLCLLITRCLTFNCNCCFNGPSSPAPSPSRWAGLCVPDAAGILPGTQLVLKKYLLSKTIRGHCS